MITRIVKLTLHPDKTGTFESIFERSRATIAAQAGCLSVAAYTDHVFANIYFTVSTWKDAQALEAYRESAFFKETWKETRALFSSKPEAWTLHPLTNVKN